MVLIGHRNSVITYVYFILLLKEEKDVKKLLIRD